MDAASEVASVVLLGNRLGQARAAALSKINLLNPLCTLSNPMLPMLVLPASVEP